MRVRYPHTARYCSVCGKWYCGVCKINRMKKRTGGYKCIGCVGIPHKYKPDAPEDDTVVVVPFT